MLAGVARAGCIPAYRSRPGKTRCIAISVLLVNMHGQYGITGQGVHLNQLFTRLATATAVG
jgi:hypothetical protein